MYFSFEISSRKTFGIESAVVFHAILRALLELLQIPSGFGEPDDRDLQFPALGQLLQRGKNLLVRQVAGGTEEYQRIRCNLHHLFPSGTDKESMAASTPRHGVFEWADFVAGRENVEPESQRSQQRPDDSTETVINILFLTFRTFNKSLNPVPALPLIDQKIRLELRKCALVRGCSNCLIPHTCQNSRSHCWN